MTHSHARSSGWEQERPGETKRIVKAGAVVGALMIGLATAGCGGCADKSEDAPIQARSAPMALKEIQFGGGKVAVERRIGGLKELFRTQLLSVYRYDPETKAPSDRTPVRRYRFHFLQQQLAEVDIFYDTAMLRKEMGREEFFATIQKRYRADEDFQYRLGGESEAISERRWFNLDTGVEVRWKENFRENIGGLTVTLLEKKAALKRARNMMRQRSPQNESPPSAKEDERLDIGI